MRGLMKRDRNVQIAITLKTYNHLTRLGPRKAAGLVQPNLRRFYPEEPTGTQYGCPSFLEAGFICVPTVRTLPIIEGFYLWINRAHRLTKLLQMKSRAASSFLKSS